MRTLVVALVRPQFEEPRPVGRRGGGNFDARDVRECGKQRDFLAHVDGIARRRVEVRSGRLHEFCIALEPGFDRSNLVQRSRRRQDEDSRGRNSCDHFEHADRFVAETIQRGDGGVLEKIGEPAGLRAVPDDELTPDVELRGCCLVRARRLSVGRPASGCHQCCAECGPQERPSLHW